MATRGAWRDAAKFVVGLGAFLLGVLDVYQFLTAEQVPRSPALWVAPMKLFIGVVLMAEGGGSEQTKEYVSWFRSHRVTQAIVIVYILGFTLHLNVAGYFLVAAFLGLLSAIALVCWLLVGFTTNGNILKTCSNLIEECIACTEQSLA